MKKAMSLFMLSLACAGTVCAQSPDASTATSPVSATATQASALTDGYYLVKCQMTQGSSGSYTKTTGYAYHNPDLANRRFRFSNTTAPNPNFSGGINNENLKYVWKLTKQTDVEGVPFTFTLENCKTQAFMLADREKNKNMDGVGAETAKFAYEEYNKADDENFLQNGVVLYQTNFTAQEAVTKLYLHSNAPGGDRNFSYWNGNGVPGTTLQVEFYRVSDDAVFEMEYVFKQTGSETPDHRQKVIAATGCNYPTLSLPYGVEATLPQGTVSAADKDQEKEIIWTNSKFTAGQFYYMDLGAGGGYLHNEAGNQMTLGNAYTTKKMEDKSQLWKFVGNPWEGYQIVNAESGGLLNANPTVTSGTGENNPVTVKGENEIPAANVSRWIATASSNRPDGFYLNLKGYDNMKMNFRGDKLAFWTTGAGPGSTFVISTAVPAQRMVTDKNESFASLYLPFAVILPEGVKAYTASSVADGQLNLTEIAGNTVPENTGVVLVNSQTAENIELHLAPESAATPAGLTNLFHGTLTATDAAGKLAFGRTETSGVGFYSVTAGTQIPANRAYLEQSDLQGQQALKLNFDGEMTGIGTAGGQLTESQAPVYDLSGRRVAKTVKGSLYIRNGKKYIAQ